MASNSLLMKCRRLTNVFDTNLSCVLLLCILSIIQADFLNFENQKLKQCNQKLKSRIFDGIIRLIFLCLIWLSASFLSQITLDFSLAMYYHTSCLRQSVLLSHLHLHFCQVRYILNGIRWGVKKHFPLKLTGIGW